MFYPRLSSGKFIADLVRAFSRRMGSLGFISLSTALLVTGCFEPEFNKNFHKKAAPTPVPVVSAANLAFDEYPSYNYGGVTAPATVDYVFTLRNNGAATATAISMSVLVAPFSNVASTCAATLAAGASCTYTIRYTPGAVGLDSEILTATYNNGVSNTFTNIVLVGTSVGPASLNFSPTSKSFASVTVGNTGTVQTFTITNSGGSSATNAYIALSTGTQFTLSSNTCGVSGSKITVAVAGTCTFDVAFSPTSSGAKSDTITVTYDDGVVTGQTQTAAIDGTGLSVGLLAFSPASKAFGNVTVGASSSVQSFTITNSGGSSATNVYLGLATGTQFAVSNSTCGVSGSKITIAAAGTCTFDAAFSPTSSGAKSDTLTITYDNGAATGQTQTAALTGTGLAVASLAFSPASKTFADVTAGSTGSIQTFTITNSGGSSATNAYIALSTGTQFTLSSNACGVSGSKITIAAAGTCTFDVAFSPTSSGAKSDTITVTYDNGAATAQTQTAAIDGIGLSVGLLAFSPASKAFADVTAGSTGAIQTFTLNNSGGSAATNVYIALATGTQFTLSSNTCGVSGSKITIAAAGTCTFDMAFSPMSSGAKSDTITVTYDNGVATGLTQTAAITGNGLSAGSLAFSPASKAFASVTAGSTGAIQTFTITNSGGSSATNVYIALTTGTQFTLSSNTCGVSGSKITIAAAGTCTFDVAFSPTTAGAKSDTITVTYDSGVSTGLTATASVSGTALSVASLAFSPTSKSFTSVTVGSAGAVQTFTITNSGGSSATNAYIALSTGTQFTLSSNTCGVSGSKITVAAAGTCTFDVAFSPTSSGAKSDTITVTYDDGVVTGQTQTAAIDGTGLTVSTLAFSPASKAFGNVTVGASSSVQSFTITNSGGSSATNVYLGLATGTQFAVSNSTCGVSGSKITIAAAGTCTFDAAFSPTSSGAKSDTLTITYDNGAVTGQTQTAAIDGTGLSVGLLAFSPTSKAFGNITAGASSSGESFTVTNSGGSPATNVYLSLTTGTQFSVSGSDCGVSGSKITIAAAGTCTFDAAFSPTSSGAKSDTLTITYDNGAVTGQTQTAALTGTGLAVASLAFSPTSKAFGNITAGASSSGESFTVTNSGGSSATNVYLSLTTGTQFSVSGSDCGVSGAKITIAAGATCSFTTTFSPTSSGAKSDTLTITYDNGAVTGQTQTAALTGTGQTVASLALSPTGINYGTVALGSRNTQVFTITNSGETTATNVAVSAYYAGVDVDVQTTIISNTCGTSGSPVSLAGGATCSFTAVSVPFYGSSHDVYDIVQVDYESGLGAALWGELVQATPTNGNVLGVSDSADTSTYNFGTVTTGAAASKTFTYTNNSGAALNNIYASTAGLDATFTYTANTCGTSGAKVTLANGASCSITVQFAPIAAVTTTGQALVSYEVADAISNPFQIANVQGTGQTCGAPPTIAIQTKYILNFSNGKIFAKDDDAPRTFTFTYTGDSVSCSHDNGSTWGACDGANSMTWTEADYSGSKILKVKASKAGCDGADAYLTYSLNSSDASSIAYPGVTFYNCDASVAANETFADFRNRITANNLVLCVNSGVTISNSNVIGSWAIALGAYYSQLAYSGVKIIGKGMGVNRGKFANTATSAGDYGVFYIYEPGIVLANLQLEAIAAGDSAIWINDQGDGGSVVVDGLSVSTTGAGSNAMSVGGTPDMNYISNSTFSTIGGSSTLVNLYASSLMTISNTTVSGINVNDVFWIEGSVTATQLTVSGTNVVNAGINVQSNGVFASDQGMSSIVTGGRGLWIQGQGVATIQNTLGGTAATIQSDFDPIQISTVHPLAGLSLDRSIVIGNNNIGVINYDGSDGYLTMNRTTLKNTGSAVFGVGVDFQGNNLIFNSSLNQNTFCQTNANGMTQQFNCGTNSADCIAATAMDPSSTFVVASQVSSGAIITCP